jgi:hypothetical protein
MHDVPVNTKVQMRNCTQKYTWDGNVQEVEVEIDISKSPTKYCMFSQ